MTSSFTTTITKTFTITHARYIAAKVATDLKRVQRFYRKPSDNDIFNYELEAIMLLKDGYLERVTYGFKRNGNWIAPTLRYTARDFVGMSFNDDDPGRIYPGADISGASFGSYLIYTDKWDTLSINEQQLYKSNLPFQRTGGEEPGVIGYLRADRTYSAGGRALNRAYLRSH